MWNQLCGIPGEQGQDYDAQISLMRQIPQLPPPKRANPITIDRFSPYFNKSIFLVSVNLPAVIR